MGKGFWILFVVTLIAVGASVFDVQWEERTAENKKQTDKVLPVGLEAIEAIEIETAESNISESKQVIRLQKEGQKWNLVQPVEDQVDYSQVTDLVGSLTSEVFEKQVAEGQSIDWSIYGLQDKDTLNRIRVFGPSLPEEGLAVRRGAQKNFEGKVYLRPEFGAPRVLLAAAKWDSLFDRKAFDLRDKRMLRSVEGLTSISIKSQRAKVNLKNQEGIWLSTSQEYKLDQNKVRESLYVFTSEAILEFLGEDSPSKADLVRYGLSKPTAEVDLTFQDGKKWQAKLGQDRDGQYFVWLLEAKKVVRIAQADFNKVKELDWRQLRDRKEPLTFNSEGVTKVTLRDSSQYINVEKKGDDWVKAGASSPEKLIASEKVSGLLDQLSVLLVEEFTSDVAPKLTQLKSVTYGIELTSSQADSDLSLQFGPAQSFSVLNTKKSLVPFKSSKSQDIFFLAETDFNKLELDKLINTNKEGPK